MNPVEDSPNCGAEPVDAARSAPTPWLAVGEALAVLSACVVAILIVGGTLALLLAPEIHQATFDLVPRSAAHATPQDELLRTIRRLGLTDDVDIRGPAGAPTLVLRGLSSTETVGDPVHRALHDAGYEMRPFQVRSWPDPDPVLLIREHPRVLLGSQSAILLAFGALFTALRVRPRMPAVPGGLPRAALVGVVAGAAGFLASGAIGLLQKSLGWTIEEQAWLVEVLRQDGAVLGLVPWLVVVAPLAEEVFFRGYLFRFLHERVGARVAYPLSAACFSLIHFHLPGLLVYFVVGLLFAWACRRTGTLAAPIVAHVTYNGAALGVALVATLA